MPVLKLFKPNLQNIGSNAEYSKSSSILSFIKYSFYGFVFSLIIISVFAVIVTYTPIGEKYISTIATLASISGALFASFKTARKFKSKGILNGIISSLFYFLTVALLGAILFEGDVNYQTLLKNLLYYIPIGALGGIIGVNIKNN